VLGVFSVVGVQQKAKNKKKEYFDYVPKITDFFLCWVSIERVGKTWVQILALSRTTSTVLGKLVASLNFCGMESTVFST
jgi:hypothetical protein